MTDTSAYPLIPCLAVTPDTADFLDTATEPNSDLATQMVAEANERAAQTFERAVAFGLDALKYLAQAERVRNGETVLDPQ